MLNNFKYRCKVCGKTFIKRFNLNQRCCNRHYLFEGGLR